DSLGEFWVSSPWQIVAHGHNLSAFERNRVFFNARGKDFFDVSHLSGADSDGDGRSVVAADFRNVGMQDLLVRQAGGGPLLLYENRLPRRSYLQVSLRGQKSNRQGIGARLTAVGNGQQEGRELYTADNFLSPAPSRVHFGLGDADKIDRLTIRWPSGKVQTLKGLKANRHVVIDEGKDGDEAVETAEPGRTIAP